MRQEQIYKAHQILKTTRYPVSMKLLQERLGVSRDTVERVLKDLEDKYHAPIVKDVKTKGRYYSNKHYELPGLWFSPEQLASLLVIEQFLEQLQAGFLADYLANFKANIKQLLGDDGTQVERISTKIRLLPLGQRKKQYEHFSTIADALIRQQRLSIKYYSRNRDAHSDRIISPQRLMLYRDNWYLDAYCHTRQALRIFAIDCVEAAELLDNSAQLHSEEELNKALLPTYGIFAQPQTDWAVLRFESVAARWVEHEIWHPNQVGTMLADGRYELKLPFGDTTELVRDILKYGANVEVTSPISLRTEIAQHLQNALSRYQK